MTDEARVVAKRADGGPRGDASRKQQLSYRRDLGYGDCEGVHDNCIESNATSQAQKTFRSI